MNEYKVCSKCGNATNREFTYKCRFCGGDSFVAPTSWSQPSEPSSSIGSFPVSGVSEQKAIPKTNESTEIEILIREVIELKSLLSRMSIGIGISLLLILFFIEFFGVKVNLSPTIFTPLAP